MKERERDTERGNIILLVQVVFYLSYLGPLLQGRIVFRLRFWMRRGCLELMVMLVGAEEMMTPAVSQMSL